MKRSNVLLLCLLLLLPAAVAEEALPEPQYSFPDGFCYLHDVIPDITEEMRYAGTDNFVGDVIDGYRAPYAIMTNEAAAALRKAADEFREMGYTLVVFDAYRPQDAVRHFVRWAQDAADTRMQAEYYPDYRKKYLLVDEGYIARNSSHTRGSAIDMSLLDENGEMLDMGTGFDFFGKKAWHGAKGLTEEQTRNRELLSAIMQRHGFKPFEKEWWHYRLKNEPYQTSFNFPVE